MVFDANDRAFALFKGPCRRGIYDNMKTAAETIFVGKSVFTIAAPSPSPQLIRPSVRLLLRPRAFGSGSHQGVILAVWGLGLKIWLPASVKPRVPFGQMPRQSCLSSALGLMSYLRPSAEVLLILLLPVYSAIAHSFSEALWCRACSSAIQARMTTGQ